MTQRECFGVTVRTLGVWSGIEGLSYLCTFANMLAKIYRPGIESAFAFLTHAIVYIMVGLILLLSPARIVDIAYPIASLTDDDVGDDEGAAHAER